MTSASSCDSSSSTNRRDDAHARVLRADAGIEHRSAGCQLPAGSAGEREPRRPPRGLLRGVGATVPDARPPPHAEDRLCDPPVAQQLSRSPPGEVAVEARGELQRDAGGRLMTPSFESVPQPSEGGTKWE